MPRLVPGDYGTRDVAEPTLPWGEAFSAGVQVQNPTINVFKAVVNSLDIARTGGEDLDYRPEEHLGGYPAEFHPYLLQSLNDAEMVKRKTIIDDQLELRRKAEFPGGGWGGFAGAAVDISTMAMAAAPLGYGLKAGTALKGAAVVGATSAAEAAITESVLQDTDPTRTTMESVYSIGGAALLGWLVGLYAGKAIGGFADDFAPATRALERDALGQPMVTSKGTDALLDFDTRLSDLKLWLEDAPANTVTAARLAKIATLEAAGHSPRVIVESLVQGVAPEKLVLHDLAPQIADQAAQQDVLARTLGISEADDYAGSLPLGESGGSAGAMRVRADDELVLRGGRVIGILASALPVGRVAQAASSIAQRLGLSISEQSMMFINKTTGRAAAIADSAETRLKQWTGGRLAAARTTSSAAYVAYKKRVQGEGVRWRDRMGYSAFRREAGKAAAAGQAHEVPEVAAAAAAYREHVLLPGIKQSMEARMVDPFIRESVAQASGEAYYDYKTLTNLDLLDRMVESRMQRSLDRQAAMESTSLHDLNVARSIDEAAIEQLYKEAEAQLRTASAITLAARIAGLAENTKAARAAAKAQVDGELAAKLAPLNTRQKKHIAWMRKVYDTYGETQAAQTKNFYGMFREKHRAKFKADLAEALKGVAKGDRAGARRVRQEVTRNHKRYVRNERRAWSEGEAAIAKAYNKDRKALLKQRREAMKEADSAFKATTDELKELYAVDSRGDYNEAVFQAYVGETPDGYLTPHVKAGVDAVKALMTDEHLSTYLTRVYDQHQLAKDNGFGFRKAVSDHFYTTWTEESAAAEARAVRIARQQDEAQAAKWAAEDASRAARGLAPKVRVPRERPPAPTPGERAFADSVLRTQAEEAAEEAYATITGYGDVISAAEMGNRRGLSAASRTAQQKGRTLNVPDEVIEPWLRRDIDEITAKWTRDMGSRIELSKSSQYYGTPDAWKLDKDLKDVRAQYYEMAQRAATPKDAAKIHKEGRQMVKDIISMRDRVLGTWNLPNVLTPNWVTTVGTFIRDYNFLAKMGGVLMSSLADVSQPVLALGLARSYGKSLSALSQGVLAEALKMANIETQKAGTACELIAPIMSHIPAEHGDQQGAAWMGLATRAFARATGLPYWNTGLKMWAGLMVQDDILTLSARLSPLMQSEAGKNSLRRIALTVKGKVLTPAEQAELAALGPGLTRGREKAMLLDLTDLARWGIDDDLIHSLAAQKHTKHGGLTLANTDEWTDAFVINKYRTAIVRAADTIIATPGTGDMPRSIRGVWPSLLVQFKSFAMAAHNRALIPMLQDPDRARAVSGVLFSVMAGTAVVALKYKLAGREDELNAMYEDDDYYALVRLAVSNTTFGASVSELENIGANISGVESAGRFSSGGGLLSTFGGPSVNMGENLWAARGVFNDPTGYEVHSVRKTLPAQNLIGLSKLFDFGEEAVVENFNLTPMKPRKPK